MFHFDIIWVVSRIGFRIKEKCYDFTYNEIYIKHFYLIHFILSEKYVNLIFDVCIIQAPTDFSFEASFI